MAVDTAEKRAASLHFAKPRGIIPPTGASSKARRGAGLGFYLIEPYTQPSLVIDFVNMRQAESTLSATVTASTLAASVAACTLVVNATRVNE